ncbi:hypothetical protein DM02DRAFT_429959 [Periconia macrospinosa]|uniref:Uncharacterized protein n=1 Tax=Periconia macrospinosa TaxID=97972 RepID=A0A2V1CZ52_9PLEO|nr:hypothetical protein DM02DRAFT_429959 [Periconia macrospinosa]
MPRSFHKTSNVASDVTMRSPLVLITCLKSCLPPAPIARTVFHASALLTSHLTKLRSDMYLYTAQQLQGTTSSLWREPVSASQVCPSRTTTLRPSIASRRSQTSITLSPQTLSPQMLSPQTLSSPD